MADAQLPYWLRLTLTPGVGGESRRRLLKVFGLPEAVFSAGAGALVAAAGPVVAERLLGHDTTADVAAALAWSELAGNHILTLADEAYPRALLDCPDPPLLLYVKGDVTLLSQDAVAIVGSRNASQQGAKDAQAFAASLARAGLVVISGLAMGIDAAAHRGALSVDGATLAVIGTGIDRIYPSANETLAREIAARGTIVSEFPLGTPPLAANFPRRNRVIAGMALGCLVVEAADRSGSLITARLSAESGREVFAVPGSIHSPLSRGCHKLIRQGAKLVESAEDVLEDLRWEQVVASSGAAEDATISGEVTPGSNESIRLLEALGHTPLDLDTLGERTGLTSAELLALLLPLELAGQVSQLPGGRFQRLS